MPAHNGEEFETWHVCTLKVDARPFGGRGICQTLGERGRVGNWMKRPPPKLKSTEFTAAALLTTPYMTIIWCVGNVFCVIEAQSVVQSRVCAATTVRLHAEISQRGWLIWHFVSFNLSVLLYSTADVSKRVCRLSSLSILLMLLHARMLRRADIDFGGVCESVRLSICTKSRKLFIWNWCNLVGICHKVNARSVSKLVTFDFDLWHWELFCTF